MKNPKQEAYEQSPEFKETAGRLRRIFSHFTPSPEACDHTFSGWREFEDGCGGEQVCSKCGMGAMTYTLRVGP